MKFIKIITCLCLMLAFPKANIMGQSTPIIKVRATVVGADKKPIAGAEVKGSDETSKAVLTDAAGKFSIDVPKNDVISIVAKGFVYKYITATEQVGEIILTQAIDKENVRVAFRDIDKKDILGGVASVNVPELLQKNYFTYSLADMEALIPGFNGNSNWGMGSYLFMIDGVPRETGNVAPTEIEQIVFLKGANAVALYGSRAAKGVVNIITKRGVAGKNRLSIFISF